jgi:hypothetical protein
MSYVEKNCSPKWMDDKYFYPRNDELKINPLFTVMAAIADLNIKNGIWALYNQPWKEEFFSQPFVSAVEYPKAVVKQAYYDNGKDALIVTLSPRDKIAKTTSFAVNQLSKSKTYSLRKNGQLLGYLRKGILEPRTGVKGIDFSGEGILKISIDLLKEQTFLVQAEG